MKNSSSLLRQIQWCRWSQLLSPFCIACRLALPAQHPSHFCQSCLDSFTTIKHACTICASVIPAQQALSLTCSNCQKHPPNFDQSIALWRFCDDVQAMTLAFKYKQRYEFIEAMSLELCNQIQSHYANDLPQALVSMPMHPRRMRQRGFNHASFIAQSISKKLLIPCDKTLVKRISNTPSQQGLSAKQRRKNLRGAFKIQKQNTRSHVAIIDDVMTTGSSANELSSVLKRSGVKRVDVWVLSRT